MENDNKRRDRGGTHVQTLGTMSSISLELHRKPTTSGTRFYLCPFSIRCIRLCVVNGKMFTVCYTGIQMGNVQVNGA